MTDPTEGIFTNETELDYSNSQENDQFNQIQRNENYVRKSTDQVQSEEKSGDLAASEDAWNYVIQEKKGRSEEGLLM